MTFKKNVEKTDASSAEYAERIKKLIDEGKIVEKTATFPDILNVGLGFHDDFLNAENNEKFSTMHFKGYGRARFEEARNLIYDMAAEKIKEEYPDLLATRIWLKDDSFDDSSYEDYRYDDEDLNRNGERAILFQDDPEMPPGILMDDPYRYDTEPLGLSMKRAVRTEEYPGAPEFNNDYGWNEPFDWEGRDTSLELDNPDILWNGKWDSLDAAKEWDKKYEAEPRPLFWEAAGSPWAVGFDTLPKSCPPDSPGTPPCGELTGRQPHDTSQWNYTERPFTVTVTINALSMEALCTQINEAGSDWNITNCVEEGNPDHPQRPVRVEITFEGTEIIRNVPKPPQPGDCPAFPDGLCPQWDDIFESVKYGLRASYLFPQDLYAEGAAAPSHITALPTVINTVLNPYGFHPYQTTTDNNDQDPLRARFPDGALTQVLPTFGTGNRAIDRIAQTATTTKTLHFKEYTKDSDIEPIDIHLIPLASVELANGDEGFPNLTTLPTVALHYPAPIGDINYFPERGAMYSFLFEKLKNNPDTKFIFEHVLPLGRALTLNAIYGIIGFDASFADPCAFNKVFAPTRSLLAGMLLATTADPEAAYAYRAPGTTATIKPHAIRGLGCDQKENAYAALARFLNRNN